MKRNYCTGSEWLYYKVYTGVQIADTILIEKLYPIIEELKSKDIIEKWFFIRYKDTDEHLRLRFYSSKNENILQIISKLSPILDELMRQDIIWKVQLDTYQREIERYGEKTMEASESLFCYDSEMILNYILLKPYFIKDDTQLLFSFLSIDSFLNSFSLTIEEKLELLNNLQLSFKKEFNADKFLKKGFDKHYRTLSDEIHSFLNYKMKDDFSELYEIISMKEKSASEIIPEIKSELEISLHSFLSSHIHMMINRQFTSKQRQYECVIYDHLYRHYKKIEYAF
ncbi:thiopeptide-type bacteriocin biosynthesis protein [Flavobacterium sp.]|uniref:thiopeptide-type bacteriocin biosynthesis protein n=1 Tax=Flavobacterium sp. TaxID=239 RepID=UPI003D6B4AAD